MVISSTLRMNKLIFIRKTSHLDSLWRGGRHELGNGLFFGEWLNSIAPGRVYDRGGGGGGRTPSNWASIYNWVTPFPSVFIFRTAFPAKSTILRSLSTRVFETPTATGSELFSLLTCLHTITFTLFSIISPLETISKKSWAPENPSHAKCSLPVAVRVSKTRVLKLTISTAKREKKVPAWCVFVGVYDVKNSTDIALFWLCFLTSRLPREAFYFK